MKRLYDKGLLPFALVWIGVYVAGLSLLENFGEPVAAAGALALSVFLAVWLKQSGLRKEFGLCAGAIPAMWYIPLAVITLGNLWCGAEMRYGAAETVFFLAKMLCVGFLEELIFRGFLFKAMCKDSVKWAVIVSSVTFGVGHIVNLLNGSGMSLAENLVQIVSAVAIGFLYVVIFHRGGSLLPCILSHGIFNCLSAFGKENPPVAAEMVCRVAICLIAVGYAVLLWRKLPKEE